MKTKVIFRKYKTGEIIALFPEFLENDCFIASYMHVGQHSCADYNGVIAQTKPATPEEYASLKKELESRPYYYELRVMQKCRPRF